MSWQLVSSYPAKNSTNILQCSMNYEFQVESHYNLRGAWHTPNNKRDDTTDLLPLYKATMELQTGMLSNLAELSR